VEISHFLRTRPWASAIALLIPLLAAVVAYLVLNNQPPRYTATATVSVPGSDANSASRVGLFVANFAELAKSGPVLANVSTANGESRADLEDGVVVTRIGQSSLFTVAYTGDDQATVEPVVRGVISGTFGNLVQVSDSDAELKAAQDTYTAAVAARTAYQDQIGTLQPDRDYTDLSTRIRSLEITPVFGGQATINQLSAQRDALVPQIRQMQELDQAVQAAATQRDQATQAAASVQRAAAEAQSTSTIQDLTVAEESPTSRILQGVGVAAVAGLLVGLTLLLASDRLRRRRVAPAGGPGTAAPVAREAVAAPRGGRTPSGRTAAPSETEAQSTEDAPSSGDTVPAMDVLPAGKGLGKLSGGATAAREMVATGSRDTRP